MCARYDSTKVKFELFLSRAITGGNSDGIATVVLYHLFLFFNVYETKESLLVGGEKQLVAMSDLNEYNVILCIDRL